MNIRNRVGRLRCALLYRARTVWRAGAGEGCGARRGNTATDPPPPLPPTAMHHTYNNIYYVRICSAGWVATTRKQASAIGRTITRKSAGESRVQSHVRDAPDLLGYIGR